MFSACGGGGSSDDAKPDFGVKLTDSDGVAIGGNYQLPALGTGYTDGEADNVSLTIDINCPS
jgi:hypothetical protein